MACDSLHWPTPVWLDVYAGRIILYLVEGEVTASSPSATVPGLTISFSGEIPVIGGNGIPFRNFGEFQTNFFEL